MWIYKNKPFENIPDKDLLGFVYLIEHIPTGKKYIGKKNFYSKRKKEKTKKEKSLITDKRRKTYDIIIKESNWRSYKSSNSFLKKEPEKNLKKEILVLCKSPLQLTYYETKFLFDKNVLFSEEWINDNILGKFYRKHLV